MYIFALHTGRFPHEECRPCSNDYNRGTLLMTTKSTKPVYLYNTLTRRKDLFTPLNPPRVSMYTCGPTVYRDIHIGNFRAFMTADWLRRLLEYNGYDVLSVRNITDV